MRISMADRIIFVITLVLIVLTYPEKYGSLGDIETLRLIAVLLFGYSLGSMWD